jgi:hypothetical protein
MIVGAFALVMFQVVEPKSIVYILLNIFGSLFLIYESYTKKDFQPVVLNAIWATITILGFLSGLL